MHVHRQERIWMTFGLAMLVLFLGVITTAAIVDGFVPPSHVQSIDPTKVSQTPPFDHPGLRKIADGAYEAYYVARIFSFTPASIEIPAGSRVRDPR
jgi:cytochrome c oxidase subunit 2